MIDKYIRAHKEFYQTFERRIIRDPKIRRELQRQLPNTKYYASWADCTKDIAFRLKRGQL